MEVLRPQGLLVPPPSRRGRRLSARIISWPLPNLLYGDLNAGGNTTQLLRPLSAVYDFEEDDKRVLLEKGEWPVYDEVPTKRKSWFAIPEESSYLAGWRLGMMMVCLGLSVFITTLEATIVSTSLITITKDLEHQDISGWINTSYLLALGGVIIIAAKLSDIFGPKMVMAVSLVIVTIAASFCGSAQTMEELIIFRAIQGIGAAGIDSMYQIILRHMVPVAKYPIYGGIIATIFIGSQALGPILGGFINDHSTWRWAFWINIPVGCISFVLLILFLPSGFPRQHERGDAKKAMVASAFHRLDFVGFLLVIIITTALVFALEEGGNQHSWTSAIIVVAFVISAALSVVFVFWEKMIETLSKGIREPVFPWRLASNRFYMGLLLTSFLTGFGFLSSVINLPQRFQIVNGMSPSEAGVRLLPFVLCTPVFAVLAGWLASRQVVPHIYILFFGSGLSTLGMFLMTTISVEDFTIHPAQYFYQMLLGSGFGASISAIGIVTTAYTEAGDLAVALGAGNQFKFLGGAVGLAMCSALLTYETKNVLKSGGASQQGGANVNSEYDFKHAYSTGYHSQVELLACACAFSLLALFLLLERKPRKYLFKPSK